MKRGEIVTVAAPGDYGKPRPALVVQADQFADLPSVTVLLLSSHLRETPLIRLTIEPSDENGLLQVSQVMIDKSVTVARAKIGSAIGRLQAKQMLEVDRLLAVFLGIAA